MQPFRKTLPIVLIIILTALAIMPAATSAAPSCSLPIPDLGSNLTNVLTVNTSVIISDVDVNLNITHTWVGDLSINLTSPGGTTISLVDRPGRTSVGAGFAGDNIITTLDDESGGGSVEDANPPTGPSYTPMQPLSSFDGENAQGGWTISITDHASADIGNLNDWALVINGTTYNCSNEPPKGSEEPVAAPEVVDTDHDDDGVSNDRDNCPHAYNPDQEDGWGSLLGDECDTDWYNMRGIGINGFEQKDGTYHLHGNCAFMEDGDPRCPEIGIFNPATFTPDSMPMEVTTEFAGTWSVWIHYLHSNGGADVYQVNVYSTNPPQPDTLLDDRLEIHVYNGGSWKWYQRGGDQDFGGLYEGAYNGGSADASEKAEG